ncbi:hypothetical protein [Ruegeria sp. HKCCA5491]|uniref:hypothetical protein n=1 Tax=Ruegeria sp. HKCCA5491 TaxID=2682986 RepID=UPI0014878B02|nr:hypothetical protein [Ruegeria sp. HKCCA5491]
MTATPTKPSPHQKPAAPQWLSKNVLCQRRNQQLGELYEFFGEPEVPNKPVRLVHVVNFFSVNGNLDFTQEATAKSMLVAAESSKSGFGETKLVQVGSPEDVDILPNGFVQSAFLERDIRDFGKFEIERTFPLLFDILDRGSEYAGANDYVIYTNADICLKEHFYGAIRQLILAGFDAVTVNRMTLCDNQTSAPQALVAAEIGKLHGGFDCFIFRKSHYQSYQKSNSCLGIGGVARPLLYNMVTTSKRMLMLQNVNLTYHFGNDKPWLDESYLDYAAHNRAEMVTTLQKLLRHPEKQEALKSFCFNHPEPKVVTSEFAD